MSFAAALFQTEGTVGAHANWQRPFQRLPVRSVELGCAEEQDLAAFEFHPLVPDHIQTKSKQTNKTNVQLRQTICWSWVNSSHSCGTRGCMACLR